MKKLYDKSEPAFALVWIGIYCAGMSVFDGVSRSIGTESAASAVFALFLSLLLFFLVKKHGLSRRFGLCRASSVRGAVFFLPLALIASFNLWRGVGLRYDALGTVFFVVKMLCVGFLEELLFRGFLFRAMCRSSTKWAVAVSSVTFGLGHILNLVNGSGMGLTENLLQMASAVVMGLLFVLLFWRSGSLWPCILSHGVFNALSAFSAQEAPASHVAILCALAAAYALLLCRPKRQRRT